MALPTNYRPTARTLPLRVGLGSRVSEFQRGLGLGSRSSREGWVSGLGLWGPPEAGFWSLNQVKTGKFRHGARQNCIFPSFMPRKSPAEHLHISDTSDSNVGFWGLGTPCMSSRRRRAAAATPAARRARQAAPVVRPDGCGLLNGALRGAVGSDSTRVSDFAKKELFDFVFQFTDATDEQRPLKTKATTAPRTARSRRRRLLTL